MPFYRYECRNCGYEFRYLHREGIEDKAVCPKCNGTDLERQLPRVAVQFKGSGYYKTDRADKKSKVGTKGNSDRDPSSDGGTENAKSSKAAQSDKSETSSKTD